MRRLPAAAERLAAEVVDRVRALLFRGREERDLDEEVRVHIEMQTEENIRAGMDPVEARRRARLAFGSVERYKEEVRDARGVRWLEDLARDIRYGARSLRRSPGFTATVVLVLALGIGANAAIFSAVSAVILRPLPFQDPDRLVMLSEENPEKGWHEQVAAPANVLDWREEAEAFQDVAMYADFAERAILTGAGEPQALRAVEVTGNFFTVLGVPAALGRTLRPEETWADGDRVAVVSHDAWQHRFGGDPGLIGRSVRLNGRSYEVVGVMAEGFAYPMQDADLWLPMLWERANRDAAWFRRAHWVRPIGRLAPGVSPDEARAQLEAVAARLEERHPGTNRLMGAGLTPLHEFIVGDTRTPLLVLLGAVGLLLLLACVNIGNLLLVRAMRRRRELAVRGALGASRWRLVRQLGTESFLLCVCGGALGLLVAWFGMEALGALRPPELLGAVEPGLDWRVLGYAAAVTAASGLFFGLFPIAWSGGAGPGEVLRESGRGRAGDRRSTRLGGALVAAEVALAALLVVGAGLLVRTVQELQRVDPGFDPAGVVTASINLPQLEYGSTEGVTDFYYELARRAQALPGVERAAAVGQLPLAGPSWTSDFTVEGWAPEEYGTEVVHREVTPGYFRTMRVPLVRGRTFTEDDGADAPHVVVINRTLARRHFPGENPVGRRIAFDRTAGEGTVWRTIVGVVGAERQLGLAEPPRIEIFSPLPQEPRTSMHLLVRTGGDRAAAALVPAVRRLIAELDPDLVPFDVRLMDDVVAESIARERFLMTLLLVFAGIALVLAVVGVYGVMAQTARQRTAELGVRLALGASPGTVMRLVVRRGLALVAIGIAIGLAAGVLATRAMAALLFEVTPTDPATLAGVALVLAFAGFLAAYVPARRASRTDPMAVLRAE